MVEKLAKKLTLPDFFNIVTQIATLVSFPNGGGLYVRIWNRKC